VPKNNKSLLIKILKWGLLTIVLAGFAVMFFQYAPSSPDETASLDVVHTQASALAPARIKIPAINVDAAIEQVAQTPDGSMDVPQDQFNVAWYKLGPRPGEQGSAVIDGHVNWKDGSAAVFADLHNLKPGDKVTVENEQGVVVSFVVRVLRTYAPDADTTDVFISNDGQAHLNLITCFGTWDKSAQSYSQRLVVFTDKEM
jgi:LPXTG-site transpeptidase (sortase) family protein